jgi:predicted outer membrane protein
MNSQVMDHQAAIAMYERQANSGTGSLKDFAAKHLPHLRMHLQKAQEIQSKLK